MIANALKYLLSFICTNALIFNVAVAQSATADSEKLATQLEQVRAKIERETGRLETLDKKQKETQRSLTLMEAELQRIKKQQSDYKATIAELQAKLETLTARIEEDSAGIESRRVRLKGRVVALYKAYRRTTLLDYLARAGSINDLLRRSHYMSVLAAQDSDLLQKLVQLMKVLQEKKRELSVTTQQRMDNLQHLQSIEKELEERKYSEAELLQELERQKGERQKTIGKLQDAAAKLEQVLSKVMGSIEKEEPASETVEPKNAVAAMDLDGVRGKLQKPIQGKIVQGYGKHRHGEYSDTLFVKGIEFKAEPGTKATAVADGRVVLQQVLPVFGKVVIVDHGQRYYTLYGRLSESLAQVGDMVSAGAPVGLVGAGNGKDRNFYFELRFKGKAIDPAPFFKP